MTTEVWYQPSTNIIYEVRIVADIYCFIYGEKDFELWVRAYSNRAAFLRYCRKYHWVKL